MKSTIYFTYLLLGLFISTFAWTDVPHIFEDGEIIRAEEMNENFVKVIGITENI